MTPRQAAAGGAAGLGVGAAILAALLAGDPAALAPAPAARAPGAPQAPPAAPAAPQTAPPVAPPVAGQPGLIERAREVVARGEGARDPAAEVAAGRDLEALLAEALRGDALAQAAALLGPGEPRGVQEVGARLLQRVPGPDAHARLIALARDRGRAVEVRLQALRGLEGAAPGDVEARSALAGLAEDRRDEPGLRAFAAHLLIGLPGGAALLEDIALDRQDDAQVRGAALAALFEGPDRARARAVLDQVRDDAALEGLVRDLAGR